MIIEKVRQDTSTKAGAVRKGFKIVVFTLKSCPCVILKDLFCFSDRIEPTTKEVSL